MLLSGPGGVLFDPPGQKIISLEETYPRDLTYHQREGGNAKIG